MIPPRAAKIRYNETTKVSFDGNSLFVYATGSLTNIPTLMSTGFLAGSTVADVAIGGQTWGHMIAGAVDIDSCWDSTKRTNVLCLWETTNSVDQGLDAAGCVAQNAEYIADRVALHPWRIVVLTCLPRRWATGDQGRPQQLLDYNNMLKANYRDIGAHAVCDVRQEGSPFAFFGDSDAPFLATQSLWTETSGWTHPTTAGNQLIAQMLESTLRRLPAR